MRRILVWLGVMALAGCAATDPLRRADLWQPEGANERNIRAELAAPADALRGRGDMSESDGLLAAAAVRRLRQDRVRPLPDSLLGDLKLQGSAAPATAAPAAAPEE